MEQLKSVMGDTWEALQLPKRAQGGGRWGQAAPVPSPGCQRHAPSKHLEVSFLIGAV